MWSNQVEHAAACRFLLWKAEVDLCGGEAVEQDHAAGQDHAQDQAFAHGPPLPPVLGSHGLMKPNLKNTAKQPALIKKFYYEKFL